MTTINEKLTGKHVFLMLSAFFGVMIAVNVVFTVFAVKTFPGEQEKKSYVQGIHYNDVLDAHARQAALGWTSQIVLDRIDGKPVLISYWSDEDGNGLTELDVTAILTRPASETGQIELTLKPDGPGRYTLPMDTLAEGVWHAEITAHESNGPEHVTAYKVLTWKP